MTYVITRKNTFEITNAVYFAESLEDATALRDQFHAEDGNHWVIALILEPQP